MRTSTGTHGQSHKVRGVRVALAEVSTSPSGTRVRTLEEMTPSWQRREPCLGCHACLHPSFVFLPFWLGETT